MVRQFGKVILSVLALSLIALLSPWESVQASTPPRFTSENWFTLPHPRVASFTVREDGSAYGLTENGISFVQANVPNAYGIRVQRFEIEDHYHYIVGGTIVYTDEALFEELTRLASL